MTITEYRTIGKAAYEAALKIPEVREAVESSQSPVSIYIICEGTKRRIVTAPKSVELDMAFMTANGFTGRAVARRVLTVSKTCEMAFFQNE